ncbi:MAG TPA: hypothetical protein VEI25_13620 [Paraburkholderia sp.]|nr:hypothetical protein [Paraburkholderia sp.]
MTVSVDATQRDSRPASAQLHEMTVDALVRISADVVFHIEALGVMSDESVGSKESGVQQLSLDLDAT